MKKLQRLRAKKGFTLIECMVAIAIFAMMSMIVMQILGIAIQSYARNDRVEKDLDRQLESLVKSNNTVERSTFDLTLAFLNSDGDEAGAIDNIPIGVLGTDESMAQGLELNTLDYDLDALPTDPDKDKDKPEDSDDKTPGVVKDYMHLYGSRGFDNIFVQEESDVLNGDIHTIRISFKVADSQKVLDKTFINSIKVALPESASNFKVMNTSGGISSLFLGHTVRMFLEKSNGSTAFDFTIEFRLPDDKYDDEYGSFMKYFVNGDSTSAAKSVTLVENINALGVYNIENGTPQVKE